MSTAQNFQADYGVELTVTPLEPTLGAAVHLAIRDDGDFPCELERVLSEVDGVSYADL